MVRGVAPPFQIPSTLGGFSAPPPYPRAEPPRGTGSGRDPTSGNLKVSGGFLRFPEVSGGFRRFLEVSKGFRRFSRGFKRFPEVSGN